MEEVNKDQQSQIDSVRGEVGQEVADRTEADKELQDQINDHSSQLDSVRGEIGQEVADRAEADKELQDQIDDHSNRLDTVEEVNKDQQSQIDSVRGEVGQEVADRTEADKELQDQINDHSSQLDSVRGEIGQEVADRAEADKELQDQINDQQGQINDHEGRLDKAESNITTINQNVGDLNYGSNYVVTDGEDTTTSIGKLDNAVGTLNNRVDALDSRVDTLDNRIDKVGANAAALAALHPLDFDPDDKWDFAAGYGNFRGENAVAVGAFYRPNEDTMFNVGTTFGTGENMVNAGVSFKIGQGNHVSTSRVAMAKEIKSLQNTVAQLTELVNALVGPQNQVQNEFNKPFPDVPENHWAYEYISKMAKQGIVEGYPDGTFGGDRTMTRYEFATIVYRALQKGLAMNEDVQRLLKEFKPELDLIRVDTIAKDKDGNPTIERVRVNKV